MHYTQTKTFLDYVCKLETEKKTLVEELESLSKLKRGTRTEEQKKLASRLGRRLKVVNKNLVGTGDTFDSFTTPHLFKLLAESEGGLWTREEMILNAQPVENGEGKCEKGIKHRLGLSLDVSRGSHDLSNNEEIKYVGDKISPFRLYQIGRDAHAQATYEIIFVRKFQHSTLEKDHWIRLIRGDISRGELYNELPVEIRTLLHEMLSPVITLSQYPGIYITNNVGFIRVPKEHYVHAFELDDISQSSPTYKFRRNYMMSQLLNQPVPSARSVSSASQIPQFSQSLSV